MHLKLISTFVGILFYTSMICSQTVITVSGILKSKSQKRTLRFINVLMNTMADSAFVSGTISNEEGRFSVSGVKAGNYLLEMSLVGHAPKIEKIYVGSL